jgi:hypothetical protein
MESSRYSHILQIDTFFRSRGLLRAVTGLDMWGNRVSKHASIFHLSSKMMGRRPWLWKPNFDWRLACFHRDNRRR